MIRHYLKIYILLSVLLSDFLMFADDDPGTGFEDESGDTSGSVDDGVPINGKLIFLAVAGILFAFYQFNNRRSTARK